MRAAAESRKNHGSMNKTPLRQSPLDADRRKGDRRQRDGNPPGKHDRRRGVEARQPDVVELDMTNSEWVALSEEPPRPVD